MIYVQRYGTGSGVICGFEDNHITEMKKKTRFDLIKLKWKDSCIHQQSMLNISSLEGRVQVNWVSGNENTSVVWVPAIVG